MIFESIDTKTQKEFYHGFLQRAAMLAMLAMQALY